MFDVVGVINTSGGAGGWYASSLACMMCCYVLLHSLSVIYPAISLSRLDRFRAGHESRIELPFLPGASASRDQGIMVFSTRYRYEMRLERTAANKRGA